MEKNKQPSALKCPSCGAPIEPQKDTSRLKCPYCGTTLNIPKTSRPYLRVSRSRSMPAQEEKRGFKDEAPSTPAGNNPAFWLIISLFVVIYVFALIFKKPDNNYVVSTPYVYVSPIPSRTPTQRPSFAKYFSTFGSAGIVSGKFLDPSGLAVDGNGNIYVVDANGGRINVFDPDGNVTSTITTEKDTNVNRIAIDSNGQILLWHNFEIHFYDMEGNETGVKDDQFFLSGLIAPDGLLYTISVEGVVSRYNQAGEIDLEIKNAFETYTDSYDLTPDMAVDGLGNIYLIGLSNSWILKFGPDGTFLDKFGGPAQTIFNMPTSTGNSPFYGLNIPTKQPGTFMWASSIALDDYGRVYVCDTDEVSVFDTKGRYIGSFDPKGICRSMAFDRENHLYILTDNDTIDKYEIPAMN